MKKIILFLLVVAASCTKDGTPPSPSDQEISFNGNSNHYSYAGQAPNPNLEVGVYARKNDTGEVYYEFNGFNSIDDRVAIVIYTDSLHPGTYKNYHNAAIGMVIDGESYSSLGLGNDTCIVTITEFKNGIVNASFHGLASSDRSINDPLHKPPVLITEGVIKNAVMHY